VFCNTQVTFDASANNARSECAISFNPRNPANIVGASKRFTNPTLYEFSLAAYASFDGGVSWIEAAPFGLMAGWAGISDPTLAWDGAGNVWLAGLAFGPGLNGALIGIAMYRSGDGGRTWSGPDLIHQSAGDDKQWAAGDNNPASPHHGNVYVVWDDLTPGVCAFARSTNNGAAWTGTAGQPAGSPLGPNSFSPQVSVAADGTVYVVWVAGSDIIFVKSTDGGASFTAPVAAVSGITPLTSPPLNAPNGFPELPGGSFRVLTIAACTAGAGGTVALSWADYREGVSRIYYAYSHNHGATWLNAASGQRLLAGSGAGEHDFHAQIAAMPNGRIGCAFYEFGPKWGGGPPLIDVQLAESDDNAVSFSRRERVTDRAWDPKIDAPLSHGDVATTFIGDYFGLDASANGFGVFWTDTRTGVQEMFFGAEMRQGPWSGTQWTDMMPAGAVIDYYTWGWPACWDVVWTPMSDTAQGTGPQISWTLQVERSPYFVTYHIIIHNLANHPVRVEGRYTILAV
jgi:hypothetical protein